MTGCRVFIWGSCVSRDTFEYLPAAEFQLLRYVARQSAASAMSKPVDLFDPPDLPSAFQRRMLSGDLASNLGGELLAHANEIDLVLVDLVDERLGLYLLPDGSILTRSVELVQSGEERNLPQGTRHLPFGDAEHLERWSTAIAGIGAIIGRLPRAQVVLLDLPWAERSTAGGRTPRSFGVGAREANPRFKPYIDAAERSLGAHTIAMRESEVLADENHPWGLAPFHYSQGVYRTVVRRLLDIVASPVVT